MLVSILVRCYNALKNHNHWIIILLLFVAIVGCTSDKNKSQPNNNFINFDASKKLSYSAIMLQKLLQVADSSFNTPKGAYPRTIDSLGKLVTTNMYDWTPGFFPGNLWYAYEATKNDTLKSEAVKWTESLEPLKNFTKHHDLGFMMYCSYGSAYRLTGNEAYKDILIQAARSLSTRFNPKVGSIKSWEVFKSWHGDSIYHYPVIVDNLMNLELLFFATQASGDSSFWKIAVSHAENAMKNQVRPDYGTYHVVCYDTSSPKVIARETAQGYADNSTWSRGQAWAIYGFTMIYRFTKEKKFLTTAEGLADYYINNKNLPEDKIPYWDFNVDEPGYTPGKNSNALNIKGKYRDASAAAITASALLELSEYVSQEKRAPYKNFAETTLIVLSKPPYIAKEGTNGNFILQHSVGSIPHNSEIDVPLVYADYYYLEALLRYKRLMNGGAVL